MCVVVVSSPIPPDTDVARRTFHVCRWTQTRNRAVLHAEGNYKITEEAGAMKKALARREALTATLTASASDTYLEVIRRSSNRMREPETSRQRRSRFRFRRFHGAAVRSGCKLLTIVSLSLIGVTMGIGVAAAGGVRSPHPVAGTHELAAVSCPNGKQCEVAGDKALSLYQVEGMVLSTIEGTPGTPIPVPGTDLVSISCHNAHRCFAVGQGAAGEGVVVPIVNGAPGPVVAVPGTSFLNGVSCARPTQCEAVGVTSSNSGVTVPITGSGPGTAVVVSGTITLFGVSCPSVGHCVAVGANTTNGVTVIITNGVAHAPAVASGTADLSAISCHIISTCEAVGVNYPSTAYVVVPITGGSPGLPVALLPSTNDTPKEISCPSASACQVVGYNVSSDVGMFVPVTSGVPGVPTAEAGTGILFGVACPSPYECQAVGAVGTDLSDVGIGLSQVMGVTLLLPGPI
jgi:hypothetical protein